MGKEIIDERLNKEFARTEKALKIIKIVSNKKEVRELYDLAKRYYEDAKYFKEKDDWISAFGALNYAFGLLDAGAKLKLFDVSAAKDLFIVD
ncbi:MAG: DUF357 domain-containing protein [Candidatus Nanoarchaeia archaeon]